MTKSDLQNLIVECLREYASDTTKKPVKENCMTLKKSELKALVNEVVRQCVKEAGPQYKVRGKKSQLEQPGLRNKAREMQDDPEINEVAPPGGEDVVKAIKKSGTADNPWAVAWAMKNKGQIEGEGPVGDEGEDETEEIRLLKGMAMIVLKLLKMHQGMEEPESEEPVDDGVPFKGSETGGEEIEPSEPETSEEPSEPEQKSEEPKEDEDEEDLDENHKVQARSFKTVKDTEGNHPERTRKPTIPQI